jgi:hypothetical protein
MVRSAALRRLALSLLKGISIGLGRANIWADNETSRRAPRSPRNAGSLVRRQVVAPTGCCADRLSMMTISLRECRGKTFRHKPGISFPSSNCRGSATLAWGRADADPLRQKTVHRTDNPRDRSCNGRMAQSRHAKVIFTKLTFVCD